MKLTEHFTLEELTASQTASRRNINNSPTPGEVNALTALCRQVLEPLRRQWGSPIRVNSGYRCPALNTAVGGVSNSQHVTGEAADICDPRGRALTIDLGIELIFSGLPFDQLIFEQCDVTGLDSEDIGGCAWLHVSYSTHRQNRRQVLITRPRK
jgi:hypothetical protein